MQLARQSKGAIWFSHAEQTYRRALLLDRQSAMAMVGLAWVLSVRHEFTKSRIWALRALAVDPSNAAAHGLAGDAALELGDEEACERHYQSMLDLRPDLGSYARAAQLLYRRGDVENAVFLMRKAIAAGSPHAENVAWCRAQLALMLSHSGESAGGADDSQLRRLTGGGSDG